MTNTNLELKNKMIERVRALLAMGGDTSSPKEAGIALKRARHLMDKHQITSIDIENCTDRDFGESGFESTSTVNRIWIGMLVLAVANMNDCIAEAAARKYRGEKINYVFKGFVEDTQICNFMMAYLIDTAERLYQRDRVIYSLSGASDKNSFLLGFSKGIVSRINQIIADRKNNKEILSTSTCLVLAKKKMVEQHFGAQEVRECNTTARGNGRAIGAKAAEEIHLGDFVSDATQKQDKIA